MSSSASLSSVKPMPYRLLIADDHAVVRRGLRSLLDCQPGLEVCAEAATGAEALASIAKLRPDLALLDLIMPEMSGLHLTETIRQRFPSTAILVLTMHFSEELAREVLRAGALGYVLKSDADTELLSAIDHVRRKEPFFTSALASTMAYSFANGGRPQDQVSGNTRFASRLTKREVDVLQLLADGKSNRETALELGLSRRTIESHRTQIMQKMKFRTFSDLVRFAVRNGLVEM